MVFAGGGAIEPLTETKSCDFIVLFRDLNNYQCLTLVILQAPIKHDVEVADTSSIRNMGP